MKNMNKVEITDYSRTGRNDDDVISIEPQIDPCFLKNILQFLHYLHTNKLLPQIITTFDNQRSQLIWIKMTIRWFGSKSFLLINPGITPRTFLLVKRLAFFFNLLNVLLIFKGFWVFIIIFILQLCTINLFFIQMWNRFITL